MNICMKKLTVMISTALLSLAAQRHSFAGSATWDTNPSSGDWNMAANWTQHTVPNGAGDIATFGKSTVTDVSINTTAVEVGNIVFKRGADPFRITVDASNGFLILNVTGYGIINKSGIVQTLVCKEGTSIFFTNGSVGESMSFVGTGGSFSIIGSASAEDADFSVSSSAEYQGHLDFFNTSTAADATIAVSDGGDVSFGDSTTAGDAVFTAINRGSLAFGSGSSADHAVATFSGALFVGSGVSFTQIATAAEGHFTAQGATTASEFGSYVNLADTATAADGIFLINGGTALSAPGALMTFFGNSTAANCTVTVNGGTNGGKGGAIFFQGKSSGGSAAISVFGNGKLDLSSRAAPGITIGSLAGDGLVFLGSNLLTIGSNHQSTTFSGLIQESGSLAKIGTGTLTLTGANTYTGTTTVSGGVLNAGNKRGSATSIGMVNVNEGTLGGKGIIAGATTIGTGSGAGAFLAPAVGTDKQITLTLQSALTLNADATYTYTFKAKKSQARTDLVVANGVTINQANINLSGTTQGRMQRGTVLTLISNTSANPIAGTFSNLPDGAIVNVNGNNLQASYTGGDGNDLALTVVP
jgi:autotransporter-associated beta strand protein